VAPIGLGQRQCVGDAIGDAIGEPGPRGEETGGRDEGRAEIDAGDPAAKGRGEIARRTAEPAADIEHRGIGREGGRCRELDGRGQAAGVELVEWREVSRRQRLAVEAAGS